MLGLPIFNVQHANAWSWGSPVGYCYWSMVDHWRQSVLSLSRAGGVEFKRALPHWEKVQQELHARFGNKRWNELLNLTNQVTAEVAI